MCEIQTTGLITTRRVIHCSIWAYSTNNSPAYSLLLIIIIIIIVNNSIIIHTVKHTRKKPIVSKNKDIREENNPHTINSFNIS